MSGSIEALREGGFYIFCINYYMLSLKVGDEQLGIDCHPGSRAFGVQGQRGFQSIGRPGNNIMDRFLPFDFLFILNCNNFSNLPEEVVGHPHVDNNHKQNPNNDYRYDQNNKGELIAFVIFVDGGDEEASTCDQSNAGYGDKDKHYKYRQFYFNFVAEMGTGSADIFLLTGVFNFVFAHLTGMGVLVMVLFLQLGVAFLDPFRLALEVDVLH